MRFRLPEEGDGDYEVWGETIKGYRRKNQQCEGSIAGFSHHHALMPFATLKSLGVPDVEVASMASFNPAESCLGLDHEIGSIEEGKRADLVAMDPDGNVKPSIVGVAACF